MNPRETPPTRGLAAVVHARLVRLFFFVLMAAVMVLVPLAFATPSPASIACAAVTSILYLGLAHILGIIDKERNILWLESIINPKMPPNLDE
jgi:hypothetical protein